MKKVPFLLLVVTLMLSVGFVFAAGTPQKSGPAQKVKIHRLPAPAAPNVVLYDQYDNPGGIGWTSQDFEPAFDAYDNQGADDFVVPSGETWNIDEVDVSGAYFNGAGPADSFHVFIYQDAGGAPGTNVYTGLGQAYSTANDIDFVITLSPAAVLTAGTYWVSVQVRMDFGVGGQWGWNDRTVQSGGPAAWQNPGGGFGTPCSTWGVRTTCLGSGSADNMFRLAGTLGPTCAYGDDFNDNTLTWTEVKPIVTEAGGVLSLTPAPGKRKAAATSDPVFTGCQDCTNTWEGVSFSGGLLAKTFLNSQFIDKRNTIQLLIKEGLDRAILKVKAGGATVAKGKVLMTFDPNTPYDFTVDYDGTTITASVNGTPVITLVPASAIPSGIVGVDSKNQTTTVDGFCSE
jgi:hypothetical protein